MNEFSMVMNIICRACSVCVFVANCKYHSTSIGRTEVEPAQSKGLHSTLLSGEASFRNLKIVVLNIGGIT
jgi:hypothetical protein